MGTRFEGAKGVFRGLKPALILLAFPGVETPGSLRKDFPQGLNRLRKKALFLAKRLKSIPQGLKPSFFVGAFSARDPEGTPVVP
jgi:hypothetical protein